MSKDTLIEQVEALTGESMDDIDESVARAGAMKAILSGTIALLNKEADDEAASLYCTQAILGLFALLQREQGDGSALVTLATFMVDMLWATPKGIPGLRDVLAASFGKVFIAYHMDMTTKMKAYKEGKEPGDGLLDSIIEMMDASARERLDADDDAVEALRQGIIDMKKRSSKLKGD